MAQKLSRPCPFASDLSIIADVVVDVSDANVRYFMENFRLFVLKGQIYVTSFTEMVPIWLVPPPDSGTRGNVPLVTKLVPALTQSKVRNNSTMEVSMRTYSSCILISTGKNINYYHDESTDQIMAELFPMGTKVVVDPDTECPCNRAVHFHNNECKDFPMDLPSDFTGQDAVKTTLLPPFASFGTSD